MDKTSYRLLTLTVSCMLFLSTTAEQVIAWPCPPPPPTPCHTCTETGWECLAECGCGGRTCPDEVHYSCIDCECICDADPYYTQNTPITSVSITSPTDFESFCVGTEEVSATCTTSTDSDIAHHCVDNVWTVEPVDDPVTHSWSGAGTFEPTTGTSVTWTPPTTADEYIITVTASDSHLYDDSLVPENPDPTDSVTVYVVEVDRIEINYSGFSWDDVTGDTIVVLKGTEYTFKAYPNPAGASWPANSPVWSGVASGTGERFIEVTFDSSGTKTLTAKCGSGDTGKTVTIDVIVPELNTVTYFSDHTIHNVSEPQYQRDPYRNEPACWTKGALAMAEVTFWHSQNLTFPTENIVVRAETSGDSWNIADWGDSSPSTFDTPWPTADITCMAESTINNQVEYRDYSAEWKYKVPWGTNAWITTTTQNNCRLYVVLDMPRAPQAQPWKEVLDIACDVAWGCDTETEAMDEIWDDFYNDAGGEYDTHSGAPRYTSNGTTSSFNLTNWLINYNKTPPDVDIVNCFDMAKAVVVFANALGCGADNTHVEGFGYNNCIYPIGCGWTNNPFYSNLIYNSNPVVDGDWSKTDGRSKFDRHAFSSLNDWIYDASGGCVDVDFYPDSGPIHFPYRYLDGDDTWTNDYKNRVIDDFPPPPPPLGVGIPLNYLFGVY